jgi:hypothetical protein
LFIEIIKDEIAFKFRGDNNESSGGKNDPPKITNKVNTDAISKKIRIKTDT